MPRSQPFLTKLLACACAAALAALLTGCPKKPKVITSRLPGGPKESKLKVRVEVDERANGGNPVALDLLLVSDKELLKKLQEMSAEEWFDKRAQIILDNPKEGVLVVSHWEWVPDQVVKLQDVKIAPEVRAAVIFARYFNPGEHRAVLDPRRDVSITLGEKSLAVTQAKK